MDINILVTLCAVLVTALAVCIDAYQTRAIHRINQRVEAFKGDFGANFGAWLLARPEGQDPEGKDFPTNLEACAAMVGRQMYQSVSMAAKGVLSGENRTMRSVEKAVLEGIETPETKALMTFADKIGVDRESAGAILQVANKYGLLPQILKNNGQTETGGNTWG